MRYDATPQYLTERLRTALATDPRVGEPELTVSIAGDKVIVSGVVPTDERRDGIAEIVAEVAPDLVFVDAVEVATDFGEPHGEERVG